MKTQKDTMAQGRNRARVWAACFLGIALIVISILFEKTGGHEVLKEIFRDLGVTLVAVMGITLLHEKSIRDEMRELVGAELDTKFETQLPKVVAALSQATAMTVKDFVEPKWIDNRKEIYHESIALIRNCELSCQVMATDLLPRPKGGEFQEYLATIALRMKEAQNLGKEMVYKLVVHDCDDGKNALQQRKLAFLGKGVFTARFTQEKHPFEVLIVNSSVIVGLPDQEGKIGFAIFIKNERFARGMTTWYNNWLWDKATDASSI